MLRTLELLEFVLYIAPWMLFALICLVVMIFLGARVDNAKDELAEKDRKIAYLRKKLQFFERQETVRSANEYYCCSDKEDRK